MADKKFKTIGLIAEDINTDYTRDIIQSIQNAIPQDENVRVFTIAGKLEDTYDTDPQRTDYVHIYNSVIFLTKSVNFDGLIIALGALRNMETDELNELLGVLGDGGGGGGGRCGGRAWWQGGDGTLWRARGTLLAP